MLGLPLFTQLLQLRPLIGGEQSLYFLMLLLAVCCTCLDSSDLGFLLWRQIKLSEKIRVFVLSTDSDRGRAGGNRLSFGTLRRLLGREVSGQERQARGEKDKWLHAISNTRRKETVTR